MQNVEVVPVSTPGRKPERARTVTKLTRVGNSTGITFPRDLLAAAHLERGDEVALDLVDGKIEISKADEGYNREMEIGRAFNARYRQAMAILSR